MKSNAEKSNDQSNEHLGRQEQETSDAATFQFVDNRPRITVQRKLQTVMNAGSGVAQLAKDRAEHDFGDKGNPAGTTATKVITPKSGTRGLYKYRYSDGQRIMDSFNGTNIADAKTAKGTKYDGLPTPNIAVAVAAHNLAGGDSPLSSNKILNGSRAEHFRHADAEHGIDRTNKYTWHHLQSVGKMELIDMNVHGAMWHYGGIAGWSASLHDGDNSDDDPSED